MNYQELNEEYYVENPLLNHLKHLGWQIYRQNPKNPEETLEITQFDQKLNPIYGKCKIQRNIKRSNSWRRIKKFNKENKSMDRRRPNKRSNQKNHNTTSKLSTWSKQRNTWPTFRKYISPREPTNRRKKPNSQIYRF